MLHRNFKLIDIVGRGAFGTVGLYFHISEKRHYAIKVINTSYSQNVSEDEILKEVQTMASIRSHFVVEYNNSWIENNSLFIQMEYCFDNIRNVLSIKQRIFERVSNKAMNLIEYFISCEIFRQITEALNYLHTIKPYPLIHRDLKPENILIGKHENKRICKLADFGLSKFIENHSDYHTRGAGTQGYMAPEVLQGDKYDISSDIYSLGIIGLEILELEDPNLDVSKLYENSRFREKIEECDEIIKRKLTIAKRHRRLSSQELLEVMKNWFIDRNDIKYDPQFGLYLKKLKENTDSIYFLDILNI